MRDEDPHARASSHHSAVVMEILPATRRAIERMAWETPMTPQRLLDRLIEHGMNRWHEARQRGDLSGWW